MNARAMTLGLGLALVSGGTAAAGDDWRYVVPPPDDPFAHPPPRALALSDRKPPDLKESVRYRGARRRYAQLVYGAGRTAAVAVVVDEVAPGEIDLYVDAGRHRDITAEDRVVGGGLVWRAQVAAVVPRGEAVREHPRTVLLRYNRVSRSLAVATCGYLEGRAELGGQPVAVRRVDGDCNGFFADPQDRLWFDVNADGKWEEFLFAPILRLGARRVAVRADAAGERLSLVPVEGTGTLRLALPATIPPDRVESVHVTVQGRDGAAASLTGLDGEATLPVGEYRVSSLLLTLKDPQGGPSWGFVFGDNGGKGPRWLNLTKDGALAVDPVGALDFSASLGEGGDTARAGDTLFVRPALYTRDGLLIEKAYRGAFQASPFDAGCHGVILLLGDGGRELDRATTGFA